MEEAEPEFKAQLYDQDASEVPSSPSSMVLRNISTPTRKDKWAGQCSCLQVCVHTEIALLATSQTR